MTWSLFAVSCSLSFDHGNAVSRRIDLGTDGVDVVESFAHGSVISHVFLHQGTDGTHVQSIICHIYVGISEASGTIHTHSPGEAPTDELEDILVVEIA